VAKPWDSRVAATLVRPLCGTRVHPNHLTTAGLATGLVAGSLYARGGHLADLGGVLLVATMIIDHADGELARMTGNTSAFGQAYDRVADLVVKLCTFVGMGVGLRDGALGGWAIAFGASAGVALLVIFNARGALARRRSAAEAFHQPSFGGFELEDILYLIAPVTWLGALPAFVVAAGIGAPVFAGYSLLRLARAAAADGTATTPPRAVPRRRALPAGVRLGLAVGIALFTVLVVYHGVGVVAAALAQAGWGLVVVAAFHLIPVVGDALGWRSLLDPKGRPSLPFFVRARWIGESVNGLLPVLQIGGNVAKARLLAEAGVAGARAGASVVVDVTLLMLSQLAFTLAGIVLLVARLDSEHLGVVVVGAALMGLMAAGFVAAQRARGFGRGARLLARFGRGLGSQLALDADALDAEVRLLHGHGRRLLRSAGWHLASWIAGVGEVWLALAFLGHAVDLATAMLLESLGQAVRAAAFAIPGALGIQEGGFVVLGTALGVPPETCLALSLAKRARELILGVPGLVSWQTAAARSVFEQAPPVAAAVRKAST